VEIAEAALAAELPHHPAASAAEARAAAAQALAVRALLLDRAQALGLTAEPERDETGREETAEDALVRALLALEVETQPPTEAECRRFHAANAQRFAGPELYEASHILFEPISDAAADGEAARSAAARVLDDLASAGHGGFEAAARAFSACPSSALGGSLGQLSRGDLAAEIEAALAPLAAGEVAREPVRSRFGWHILRLDRRIPGRTAPFEAVEAKIRLHLESRAWVASARAYVAQLAEAAKGRGVAISSGADGEVRQGPAMLGDLLAEAASGRFQDWLAGVDPALFALVEAAAADASQTPADFVRACVAQFAAGADDAAWAQAVSRARDGDDPALACLQSVLNARLDPPRPTYTVIRRRS
jgi:peptidyl-prolyl cis-trans isomerase C